MPKCKDCGKEIDDLQYIRSNGLCNGCAELELVLIDEDDEA